MATATTTANNAAPLGQRVAPIRPYKDFLTPSLHRRFTNAALIGLAVCYLEAIFFSKPSIYWSWFPLGLTGVRTLLLFLSCLTIFILRVAQLHVGERTTTSPSETLWKVGSSSNTLQTILWYCMSAFLFSEVYMFSAGEAANLAWIDPGRSYERPRLNERPILLRTLFFCLALGQAFAHLQRDYDRLQMPSNGAQFNKQAQQAGGIDAPVAATPLRKMQRSAGLILQRSASLTISTALIGPFVYFALLRRPAWAMAYTVGKSMFTLPKSSRPSGLTDASSLMARFVWSGLLLSLLWETSNQAFTMYASEEPTKKGLPLTTDSKDPNGTLIAGLKAKKQIPRSMAFWELAVITDRFDERRRSLYQDIDRRGGSTWSQISTLCLAEIQNINKSIQAFQQPDQPQALHPQPSQQTQTLPKVAQPLRQDNILNAASRPSSAIEAISEGLGAAAKSFGQSPTASPVAPRVQKLLEYGTNKVLTQEQQQQVNSTGLKSQIHHYVLQFVRTPLGILVRQPFHRRVNAIVFGTPFSQASDVQHAIQALCTLTVCSLKEDNLGQVAKDVANIIRMLVATTQSVQNLLQTLPPHWTDVEFDQKRQIKEVDELLTTLRSGLEQVLLSFGEYADALGLSRAELRIAKEVANKRPEMEVKKTR